MNCHSIVVCFISLLPFVGMVSTNQDADECCSKNNDPESSGRDHRSLPPQDSVNVCNNHHFMEMQFTPMQNGYHSSPLLSETSNQQEGSVVTVDVTPKLESYGEKKSSLDESSVATPKPRYLKSRIPVFSNMDFQICSDIEDDPISHPICMHESERSSFSKHFFQSYPNQHDHFSRRGLRRNKSLDNIASNSFIPCNCSTSSFHGWFPFV